MKWCKTHADWQASHISKTQCRWAVKMLGGQPEKPCQIYDPPEPKTVEEILQHVLETAATIRLTDFVTPDNPQGMTIQDKPRTWRWWKR